MADHEITLRGGDRQFDVGTDRNHSFVLARMPVYVLEVEDIHFHHNSAVLLPDCATDDHEEDGEAHDDYAGIAVLAAALRYAKEHAAQLALIMGHTDPSGDPSVNNPLSLQRAKSVLYLLQGTEDAREQWRTLSDDRSKVEDYQLILKYFGIYWNWGCDAGPVDNDRGSRTKRGVEAFQDVYNRRVAGKPLGAEIYGEEPAPGEPDTPTDESKHIGVDGDVGPDTWGAIFDVYQHTICKILGVDAAGAQELRDAVTFVDEAKPAVGCGEYFPIEAPERASANPSPTPSTNEEFEQRAHQLRYRSHEDRRVEIRFFEEQYKPDLDCHPSEDAVSPELCQVCNRRLYEKRFIPVDPEKLKWRWRFQLVAAGPGKLADREALANKPYKVTRSGTGLIEGTSNAVGVIEIPVMDDQEDLTIQIDGWTITLLGGDLPVLQASNDDAIKHRLWNLGFGPRPPTDWDDPTYAAARRAFKKQELGVDDDVFDDGVVQELRQRHGS